MGKIKTNFTIEEIIRTIKEKPITAIAVNDNGIIKACIPLNEPPSSLEEFDRILRCYVTSTRGREYAVSLISQDKRYSKDKLQKEINSSIEALQYSKTHKLKPGVNIPGNTRYYSIKKKLAKKLKMHP